ncbi:hypothetical protein C8F01DRAFT_674946 [Mycena amicta]|nr:hypothetical protein C8F01DRAFT_674946 [Mycena amicta]
MTPSSPLSSRRHFTLHEFLANASGVSLSDYDVLQELTTSWCPEREEHGYTLTPLFKCTNPRVATAHRWHMVDRQSRRACNTDQFPHTNPSTSHLNPASLH